MCRTQLGKFSEGHADHLVHVVVAVSGEASYEADIGFLLGALGVAGVERSGGWCGEWVEWFFSGAEIIGVFANDGRVRETLAGDVFGFNDAGEIVIIRVVDLHGRQRELTLDSLGLKPQ